MRLTTIPAAKIESGSAQTCKNLLVIVSVGHRLHHRSDVRLLAFCVRPEELGHAISTARFENTVCQPCFELFIYFSSYSYALSLATLQVYHRRAQVCPLTWLGQVKLECRLAICRRDLANIRRKLNLPVWPTTGMAQTGRLTHRCGIFRVCSIWVGLVAAFR